MEHKLENEIYEANGKWNDVALEISKDAEELAKMFYEKHKGKFSTMALEHILVTNIWHQRVYANLNL
jgi:hypothetical protein